MRVAGIEQWGDAVPALTAVQALNDALGEGRGDQLLVNGAGGGVAGGLAVSLAVRCGARALATAGPSSRERVLATGSTGP